MGCGVWGSILRVPLAASLPLPPGCVLGAGLRKEKKDKNSITIEVKVSLRSETSPGVSHILFRLYSQSFTLLLASVHVWMFVSAHCRAVCHLRAGLFYNLLKISVLFDKNNKTNEPPA